MSTNDVHGAFFHRDVDINESETYKSGGLIYFNLIMDDKRGNVDEIVQDGYEEDTIQSYFSVDKIYEFVGDKAEILYFHITVDQDSSGEIYGKRAHIVLRKK